MEGHFNRDHEDIAEMEVLDRCNPQSGPRRDIGLCIAALAFVVGFLAGAV